MTRFSILILSILLGGLTGCSNLEHRDNCEADTTIHLTATFISPIDVKLEWRDPATNAVGYIVEFTNDTNEEYIHLGFFPPTCTNFTHPRLMPETKFYYRVRPYYGQASKPVDVSLPKELTAEAYAAAYALPENYEWAPPATRPEPANVAKNSIRNTATLAEAAPSDLKAELIGYTVSGFKLTWTDHASDEEGFLLERKHEGSPEYSVCALVDPNINSFGWAFEPPEKKGSFRVRAYYCGKPSNTVMKLTGKDPEFQ